MSVFPNSLKEIRHTLHQKAEPSGQEFETQKYILQQLSYCMPTEVHTMEDSHHILALFDSGFAGPTLLFRGDFDAVRVPETIEIPYASTTSGVSHKCGHDGHAAILLGLAEQLYLHPIQKGKVLLFFQAAEETGQGAAQLLDSGILSQYNPDKVYALHNIPGEEIGSVICRPNSFTCSVVSCDIELYGRTSHAAEPLKAVSPYPAAKKIADKLLALNQYNIHKDDFRLLTLVEFRVGEPAYGVTAGHGVLRFTLRAKEDTLLQKTKQQLYEIVDETIAHTDGLTAEIEWKEYFAASKNQPEAVRQIQNAAEMSKLPYIEKEVPFSWGEDFGLFTQHYEGALFGLGSGLQQPSLHHQLFDFPDELLPIGVKMFYSIIEQNK